MADPAPAAAPAAKPAAPPPTPSGKAQPSFDVRMALAKNLGAPRGDAPLPPNATTAAGGNIDADPANDPVDDAATDPEPTEPLADGTDPDADGDAGEPGEALSAEAQLEAVTKAFESGDVDAMAKALEKPGVKIAGPVRRAFRAFQRREQKAAERDRKADERDRNFDEAKTRAQQSIAEDSRRVSHQERGLIAKYGWAHEFTEAWEAEDMLRVSKALEKGAKGASLATITQKLASGKTGKTPEEKELADRLRKLEETTAAERTKEQQAAEKKRQAESREAAVERVGAALKSHPYLETTNDKGEKVTDPEALTEVFAAYEASWNGEKFTKTARQCADALQEKLVARAKARGLAPAPAAAKPGKTPPAPVARRPAPRATREPPRSTATARGTPADLEQTRANRLAQARRLTEMQRRGVR